ncbi:MAG: hypothetical protein K6E57_01850 [Fibrobacter sp.]|nr:hypothetical protein [Fibrobacter sp.]
MKSPIQEYLDLRKNDLIEISATEMQLSYEAETFPMEREDVDALLKYLKKLPKPPERIARIIGTMESFVKESNGTRTEYRQMVAERERENVKRQKLRLRILDPKPSP